MESRARDVDGIELRLPAKLGEPLPKDVALEQRLGAGGDVGAVREQRVPRNDLLVQSAFELPGTMSEDPS